FAEQALAEFGALVGIVEFAQADGFDGHRPADGGIDGQINHTHRAPAELSSNLIAADAIHAVARNRPGSPAPRCHRIRVCDMPDARATFRLVGQSSWANPGLRSETAPLYGGEVICTSAVRFCQSGNS